MPAEEQPSAMTLEDGCHVGVIGGGPAGSFFSYFLLQLARRTGIDLQVDIYERRDFSLLGAPGCNMCAGVISESLVQALSVEGIDLPPDVVQRGINSFIFHTAEEDVTLRAPFHEMRIAATYRGAGPKGARPPKWQGLDGYLLKLAADSGARIIRERVTDLSWSDGKPQVHFGKEQTGVYDLVAGAIGVNTPSISLFQKLGIGYRPPRTRKTGNCEFELGAEQINATLGTAMHGFLLNYPKLDFSAIIPKGDYVTLCLIGDNINSQFVDTFLNNPVVRACLTDKREYSTAACHCAPLASLGDAVHPFGDRVVLLGDCGATRLNKDGIGSAYRVAKTAAVTALFRGVSSEDFQKGYWPICRAINNDNKFGRVIFFAVEIIKRSPFLTRAVMRMARREQQKSGNQRHMSRVLWDMFTGSAPYRDVFLRCLHPAFLSQLLFSMFGGGGGTAGETIDRQEESMNTNTLGKLYRAGEIIVRQGEIGDSMYVIQSGQVEVVHSRDEKEIRLAVLGPKDVFGEMAIFQKEVRSATVRALTDVRVLTVDKRIFLRRVNEDPSFVFPILQKMSQRIRDLDAELTRAKAQ